MAPPSLKIATASAVGVLCLLSGVTAVSTTATAASASPERAQTTATARTTNPSECDATSKESCEEKPQDTKTNSSNDKNRSSGYGPSKNVKWEEEAPSNNKKQQQQQQHQRQRQQQQQGRQEPPTDPHSPPYLLPPHQCALYLAPSTLPNSNLGLFSGTSIPPATSANEYLGGTFPGYNDDEHPPLWTDIHIPIADHYKTLPYRGQQKFPSWLGYIWPKEEDAFLHDITPFPIVPPSVWEFDEGLNSATGLEFYMNDVHHSRVSSFVPGIASLANSHEHMSNMDRNYDASVRGYGGLNAPWDAGAGAFTPHGGVEFVTTKGVWAGMELLLNYGESWHMKHGVRERSRARQKDLRKKNGSGGGGGGGGIHNKDHDDDGAIRQKKGFVEGIKKKYDLMDIRERSKCPAELPTEKGKRDRLSVGMAVDSSELKDGGKPYSDYRVNDYHPSKNSYDRERFGRGTSKKNNSDGDDDDDDDEENGDKPSSLHHPKLLTKPLSNLEEHGICLSSGKLRAERSPIHHAGRGVFSNTHIHKGETILSSPLLAIKQDDFTIYKSDPSQDFVRNVLDKTTIVGQELLLNYAFSHPDSPMLLVPTAPLANFINHGGPFTSEKPNSGGANVVVRWPEEDSNTGKLFDWVFNNGMGDDYKEFDATAHYEHNAWLKMHPLDVMERSGKLALEYVALRDIHNNEEILIDYGPLWDQAWNSFMRTHPYARSGYFRHSIGVPPNLYPSNWLHVSDKYEIAEIQDLKNKPLKPGEVLPMTWAHNGKPLSSKYAYVVGLPEGFSDKFLEYSKERGVIELYKKLLTEQEGYHLPSDGFGVYRPGTLVSNETSSNAGDRDMELFAHRYHSDQWNFNMHFVAAWDDAARKSILTALGDAGFDEAVRGIGERFGYNNLTCFHASYMGVTHCDKSKMHSDIYATDDKSWNIVFPLITVEGTDPELDVMAEDMNTIIGVHYLKDVAYAMGDFGYHQTRPIAYYDPDEDEDGSGKMMEVPIRVVFGAYCAQIDETNVAMLRHIYDGDDPAPFADQFADLPMREIHWDKATGTSSLGKPGRG